MRRGRILILLVVVLLIVAVLAMLLLPRVLPGLLGATPTPVDVQVYYSAQSIPQGEPITDERLGTRTLPQNLVTEDMFTQAEHDVLVGKIAKYPFDQGVFITQSMIANPDESFETGGPQWASLIPVGMNAISVPTTRLNTVAYGVQDGAHVNVTACMMMVDVDPSFQTTLPNHVGVVTAPSNVAASEMSGISLGVLTTADAGAVQGRAEVEPAFQQGIYVLPSEAQRPRVVCQMILQDVQVLKLGTYDYRPQQTSQQDQTAEQATSVDQLPPDIVTLVVSPQDAVTLTYMIYSNIPLNLTLRRSGDASRQATEAATLQFLLSQYNIPVPVKLAYGLAPRLDFLSLPFLPNDVVTVSEE
ncbi:MAG: hypothetical protein HFACDABA_01063 [Anaerolineales bacterium]|nr:hypothetical protein [Anaerolineales bacterium]